MQKGECYSYAGATKIGSKGRQRRLHKEGIQSGANRQILIQAVRSRSRLKFKQ